MEFSEKLKKAMQDLNITQVQLVGLTGASKSAVSQYLSGKNIPPEEKRKSIATALGLAANYFENDNDETVLILRHALKNNKIKKLDVVDAAKLLGMNSNTVRKGLQQRVFPWGYAIRTSENRWTYFINAKRFIEIEGV